MDEKETKKVGDMKYNELKSLASSRGLNASGTKEDLIARLSEVNGPAPVAGTTQSTDNDGAVNTAKGSVNVSAPQSAEQLHRSTALRQKAHLDKQTKVSMFIPFEQGENPESAKLIPMTVTINGHVTEVPRGVMTEVPVDVAHIIQERLESEGRASRDSGVNLASATQARRDALGA